MRDPPLPLALALGDLVGLTGMRDGLRGRELVADEAGQQCGGGLGAACRSGCVVASPSQQAFDP